jgi:hypothetical protein
VRIDIDNMGLKYRLLVLRPHNFVAASTASSRIRRLANVNERHAAAVTTLGKPTNWPRLHKAFGEDWLVARNLAFGLLSVMAATFGYLTLNIKNGCPLNGGT